MSLPDNIHVTAFGVLAIFQGRSVLIGENQCQPLKLRRRMRSS